MSLRTTGSKLAAAIVAVLLGACQAQRAQSEAGKPSGLASAPARAKPAPTVDIVQREVALDLKVVRNLTAHVPPQCYTKTRSADGGVHNPCYTCHVASRAPNYIDDADLQTEYAFSPAGVKLPWTNLLIDWSARISAISDEEIRKYIRQSNYFGPDGGIVLAEALRSPPPDWDADNDGNWAGYVPDAYFRFDERGFDHAPNGDYTGWRAFAYYPLPGTFFPTNGSMGDVLIRLSDEFRKSEAGEFSREIYELNLAVVEALISRQDVASAGGRISFHPQNMTYAGRAGTLQKEGQLPLAPGLFPVGTEFLHTVRYLDPKPGGGVQLAARMKEVRYSKKYEWWSYERLEKLAKDEANEEANSPNELKSFGGQFETGVLNEQGWRYQGFIEDARGDLRPQSFEETAYCVGCHGGVGRTEDGIFSFARKLDAEAFQGGWFHWTQQDLKDVGDRGEYSRYLELNGAGDEFRQNREVSKRFFDQSGKLLPGSKKTLARDASALLVPSPERALALDKAYRLLVREQSFRFGRELVLDGAKNVHQYVPLGEKTGVAEPIALLP